MASYILGQDTGVFKLGMAVAPVTDWRYYGMYGNLFLRPLLLSENVEELKCFDKYFSPAIYLSLHQVDIQKGSSIYMYMNCWTKQMKILTHDFPKFS